MITPEARCRMRRASCLEGQRASCGLGCGTCLGRRNLLTGVSSLAQLAFLGARLLPLTSKATALTVTDIRSKVEGSDEKSSLVTRIAELEETPVLTLVDAVEPSEVERRTDPLIQALVHK